jgi:hypothetical protein
MGSQIMHLLASHASTYRIYDSPIEDLVVFVESRLTRTITWRNVSSICIWLYAHLRLEMPSAFKWL